MKKICTKCGESKPATLEFFHRHKTCRGGLCSQCKDCSKENAKKWRENNPEKEKARIKKWRENNPEKNKARIKKWRENNPEKVKAHYKKWYDDNPEKAEKANARNKKWQENNPDKVKIYKAKWRSKNHKKQLEYERRQRAILADFYVVATIHQQFGIPRSEIDEEFIEAKREQLQNYRQLKKLLKNNQNG